MAPPTSAPITHPTRPISVDELRRAYRAAAAGDFRRRPRQPGPATWSPGAPVLPVLGASPSSGASTMALALATLAARSHLLDCAPPSASGLASTATAEHGHRDATWLRGTRGPVIIDRPMLPPPGPGALPTPPELDTGLVVVDVAWRIESCLEAEGWLAEVLRRPGPVVVTASATLPGLRRLERTLDLLGHADPVVAILDSRRGRTPRPVTAALEAFRRDPRLSRRVVAISFDAHLSTHGPDSSPLPPAVLKAAAQLLAITRTRKDQP